ncbi:unnamed protein product [Bursaphelenchus xylophilus]|uniref:(pine wood nematode) hypothetical protein n=1 Tax=Bursaphelenchus xylophilus TaxID=6326 RepID=A0A1I7S8Z2_BURXY|nr:unnamed protein product [Bursaphelenchus xylophilus]CAG9086043.1 unnamed protein product [Bursaphelenchus xylophilus]
MALKSSRNKSGKGGNGHAKKTKKVIVKKAAPNTQVSKKVVDKKNVSFSATLEESRLIEDVDTSSSIGPSSTTKRVKGILKGKEKVDQVEVVPENEEASQKPLKGKKRSIIVKKSVKEHLKTLTKKERRQFIRTLRAKTKPNFGIAMEAKKIWEKLRSSKTPKAEKEKLTQQLYELVKGKTKDIIHAHDTSRVIQCLLATGNEEVRDKLFEELTPEIVRMAKSPYARFFLVKMLKYGNRQQKIDILNAFRGHCVNLLRNKWSANILETVYNDLATADQRNNIVREFYGNEFVIFKDENNYRTIEEVAKEAPSKIPGVVKNLEDLLNDVIEKGQLKLSLVHKLLWDYLQYCPKQQKLEMVQTIKEFLPEICHTREGAFIAMDCIWEGDVKTRKAIVKSFKGLSVKAALDKYSRRVLYAIFDSVDDTVLVNKIIVKEIADEIADVIYNAEGVQVLHYLVHPRDGRVLGKGMVEILKKGDANEFTKKPAADRYKELFSGIKESLYSFLAANMKECLYNKVSAVLVLDALEPTHETELMTRQIEEAYLKPCFDAIAKIAGEEFIPNDITESEQKHIIQGGAARFVLTKLLKADVKQPVVKLSDSLCQLPAEQLRLFTALNSGCFDLYHMCLASEAAQKTIKKAVSIQTLKSKGSFLGAKLLHEKLTGKKFDST